MKKRTAIIYFLILGTCLVFPACSTNEQPVEETQQQIAIQENVSENTTEDKMEQDDAAKIEIPSKEKVIATRKTALEGMSDDEIERLTENIKVANLRLESAYLNDDIFEKLSDKDSLYWNYFDQKGDIQIGWAYDGSYSDMKTIMEDEGISQEEFYEKYGEPVMDYNRFDATNFINLIQDMQESVHNELLIADLQQLIDLTILAEETHEMEYVNDIYKILHDLDYFLLRYGIEDVGTYTRDDSLISTYYDVLTVYGATPLKSVSENQYHVLFSKKTENDAAKYGDIKQEHEEFQNQDEGVYFYYDMECFYFNDDYPEILNETLQTYYDSIMESYRQDSKTYEGDSYEESNTPYDSLIFQYFSYVGEDYVSLVYNNVTYMGGAHPYSALDGITIDCRTGEIVSVNRFIDDSDEEIGMQLKNVLGIDEYDSKEWDYYITEKSVVFFYYDPRFWDSVATKRVR